MKTCVRRVGRQSRSDCALASVIHSSVVRNRGFTKNGMLDSLDRNYHERDPA